MCSNAFQVRIACIIPLRYDTVVGGANNDKPMKWEIVRPSEWRGVVDCQMKLLQEVWHKRSDSRINITWKLWYYEQWVKMLRRHDGRHEIDDRPFRLFRRECASAGAMYWFTWIVFDPSLSGDVPDQAHPSGRRVWIPCLNICEFGDGLRSGVDDEFRHSLKNALCRARITGVGALKVHKTESFVAAIRCLLTEEALQKLQECFGYRPEWQV